MPARKNTGKMHTEYHRDGSVWAKGRMLKDLQTGYWEWFRKDGTKMRTGYFEAGRQVGEWTTFDKNGRIVKVTAMKPAGR
jgi:antitoxin component YwqK of YwqJK toxin-antitoxin module